MNSSSEWITVPEISRVCFIVSPLTVKHPYVLMKNAFQDRSLLHSFLKLHRIEHQMTAREITLYNPKLTVIIKTYSDNY